MQYNGIDFDTYYKNYPDKNGYFGKYANYRTIALISHTIKVVLKIL